MSVAVAVGRAHTHHGGNLPEAPSVLSAYFTIPVPCGWPQTRYEGKREKRR